MIKFTVHVRKDCRRIRYTAIGSSSADVADAAIDRFGICSVFVVAQ